MIQFAIEEDIAGSFHHGLTVHTNISESVVVDTVLVPEHSVSVAQDVEHDCVVPEEAVELPQTTMQDEYVCDTERVLEVDEELTEEVMLPEVMPALPEPVGVLVG